MAIGKIVAAWTFGVAMGVVRSPPSEAKAAELKDHAFIRITLTQYDDSPITVVSADTAEAEARFVDPSSSRSHVVVPEARVRMRALVAALDQIQDAAPDGRVVLEVP